jgi:hypothetical protein
MADQMSDPCICGHPPADHYDDPPACTVPGCDCTAYERAIDWSSEDEYDSYPSRRRRS